MKTRTLKIELAGDFHRARTFPKIRLQGQWLPGLGFTPNSRVEVIPGTNGVITLQVIKPTDEKA